MKKRIDISNTAPAAIKAILALENYLQTTQLSNTHKELIKIRASQINGCAYCINMHTKDARKYGETEQRIYLLNAWRDTNFFTEEEQVLLTLTEEITLISHGGVSEETYQKAINVFNESYLSQIIMAIITINVWNRIGISTKMEPVLDEIKK